MQRRQGDREAEVAPEEELPRQHARDEVLAPEARQGEGGRCAATTISMYMAIYGDDDDAVFSLLLGEDVWHHFNRCCFLFSQQ